eukprot:713121-Rhodomonas_salina.3
MMIHPWGSLGVDDDSEQMLTWRCVSGQHDVRGGAELVLGALLLAPLSPETLALTRIAGGGLGSRKGSPGWRGRRGQDWCTLTGVQTEGGGGQRLASGFDKTRWFNLASWRLPRTRRSGQRVTELNGLRVTRYPGTPGYLGLVGGIVGRCHPEPCYSHPVARAPG